MPKEFIAAIELGSSKIKGVAVDEHNAMLPARKHGCHRRAADAADALDGQRRPGEECAGAARGDNRVALAVLQHGERNRH